MKDGRKYVGIGIVIGIIFTSLYFYYFAPRYEIQKMGLSLVKIDKWTGHSWQHVNGQWKGMTKIDEGWKSIDRTLRDALQVSSPKVDTEMALRLLKEKYPVLNDISNDELLERIKLVYSKQILCDLYLSNFFKLQKAMTTEQ